MIAVHIEDGRVEIRRKPMPKRPKGHALISLVVGGICNTDLELQRGYYGFRGTPGHEFVGEVVEADDARWVGKRVVARSTWPAANANGAAAGWAATARTARRWAS